LLSFVSEFSRLQYEWSSDCWRIWKSFGVNACLQRRKYFHVHWRSVFVQFFCDFFEVIYDCGCALADQYLYAGIIRALLYLPRLALRAEKFQESSLHVCTLCTVNVRLWNGICNKYLTWPYPPAHDYSWTRTLQN
jgi:hypothetical protein